MTLSPAQKRFLRGMTHHINPVVIVGDKGLTENVLEEIEIALDHHELIKVKLRSELGGWGLRGQEVACVSYAAFIEAATPLQPSESVFDHHR